MARPAITTPLRLFDIDRLISEEDRAVRDTARQFVKTSRPSAALMLMEARVGYQVRLPTVRAPTLLRRSPCGAALERSSRPCAACR